MSGLLHSFLYYLFGRGFSSVLMFAQILFLTQMLPAEDYGRYSYIFSTALLYNALHFLWIRVYTIRYLEEKGFRCVYGILVKYFAISYVIGVLLLFAVSALVGMLSMAETVHLAILFLLLGWFETNLGIFRAQIKPQVYNVYLVLKSLSVLVFTVGLVWRAPVGLSAVSGCSAGYLAVILPMTVRLFRSRGKAAEGEAPSTTLAWKDIFYGVSMSAGVIVPNFFVFIDKTLIAYFVGDYSLGVFSMIYDFGYKFLILPFEVVNLSFLPIIVREFTHGTRSAVSEYIRKNFSTLVLLGAFATFLIVVLRQELTAMIFKSADYAALVYLLPLLSVNIIVDTARQQCYDVRFYLKGINRRYFTYYLLFIACGLVLRWLIISRYGTSGVFVSMLLTASTGLLLSNHFGDKDIVVPVPFADIARICCSALAAYMATLIIPAVGLIAAILVKGSLYCTVFAALLVAFDVMGIRNRIRRHVYG